MLVSAAMPCSRRAGVAVKDLEEVERVLANGAVMSMWPWQDVVLQASIAGMHIAGELAGGADMSPPARESWRLALQWSY